jgi:arginyl-tRNA synthetase
MISIKKQVSEALSRAWNIVGPQFGAEVLEELPGVLLHPDERFGDISCNIAMISAKRFKKNPMEIAKLICSTLLADDVFLNIADRAEAVAPGFVNVYIRKDILLKTTKTAVEGSKIQDELKRINVGRSVLLEHTSPNTNKSLHIGHLRNNIFGMALVRLLEATGCDVSVDCVFNDRGVHICKAMWGYLKQSRLTDPWKDVLADWAKDASAWATPESAGKKPDHFVADYYGIGVKGEEESEANKTEIQEMLIAWEANDPAVRMLWKKMNDWVYAGFEMTLGRLGSRHDFVWHESEYYQSAKDLVDEGLKQGVFKQLEDGAVLTQLEPYGLTDTIVRRSDGTSMYFTQDIYLTKLKTEKYPNREYIWVVGPEQQLHLQQVFAVCDQLKIVSRDQLKHFWYGYVFLRGQGKMSSRKGTVVSVDDLADEAKKLVLDLMKESQGVVSEESAEKIGMSAIKYAMLKPERNQDIDFDWKETLNFRGNTGPYLQYVWTRCFSVREKASSAGVAIDGLWDMPVVLTEEESILLRTIPRYSEAVAEATLQYSPHVLANYLFDLAQKYNAFYDHCKILGSESQAFRLALTSAVMLTMKRGLEILGIDTVESM